MTLSPILVPPIAVVAWLFVASVVNALQGGIRGDLGLSSKDILGVSAEEATSEHIEKLGERILSDMKGVAVALILMINLNIDFDYFSLRQLSHKV